MTFPLDNVKGLAPLLLQTGPWKDPSFKNNEKFTLTPISKNVSYKSSSNITYWFTKEILKSNKEKYDEYVGPFNFQIYVNIYKCKYIYIYI